MNYILVSIISGILILAGILGSLLPILPGLPVSFLGLLIFAIYTKFADISGLAVAVFAILIAVTMVLDVMAPAWAAKQHKASGFGVAGAMIGAFFGIFILGPIGILVGPFLGAYIGELANGGNKEHAFKSAYGALVGLVIGTAFKMIVGVSMFIYFLIRVF